MLKTTPPTDTVYLGTLPGSREKSDQHPTSPRSLLLVKSPEEKNKFSIPLDNVIGGHSNDGSVSMYMGLHLSCLFVVLV